LTPEDLTYPTATSKLFVLRILQNIVQLQYYTAVVLELLRKGSYSLGSPEQLIIEQLYKSAETSIHTAVLIASTNKLPIPTNARLTRKQVKKRSYIAFGGVLTGEEGAELAELAELAKGKEKAKQGYEKWKR
jgi:hypothetical protein